MLDEKDYFCRLVRQLVSLNPCLFSRVLGAKLNLRIISSSSIKYILYSTWPGVNVQIKKEKSWKLFKIRKLNFSLKKNVVDESLFTFMKVNNIRRTSYSAAYQHTIWTKYRSRFRLDVLFYYINTFKGTVSVISNGPPCKDGNAWLTVPNWNLYLINNVVQLVLNVFISVNSYICFPAVIMRKSL